MYEYGWERKSFNFECQWNRLAIRGRLNKTGSLFVTLPTYFTLSASSRHSTSQLTAIFLSSLCQSRFLILHLKVPFQLLLPLWLFSSLIICLSQFKGTLKFEEHSRSKCTCEVIITRNPTATQRCSTEIYLYQTVTSSDFNIDFDRLEDECSPTHFTVQTEWQRQRDRSVRGDTKKEHKLTKVIKLKFISIRMSENVTLIQFLTEQKSLVKKKKAINANIEQQNRH